MEYDVALCGQWSSSQTAVPAQISICRTIWQKSVSKLSRFRKLLRVSQFEKNLHISSEGQRSHAVKTLDYFRDGASPFSTKSQEQTPRTRRKRAYCALQLARIFSVDACRLCFALSYFRACIWKVDLRTDIS